MESKKNSKLKFVVIGLLVGIVAIFIGGTLIRQTIQFRPYHKLATELSSALGGGFTITETKYCSITGPKCPSVKLTRGRTIGSVGDYVTEFKYKTNNMNLKNISDKGCSNFRTGQECGLEARSNNEKLKVGYSINDKEELIIILKP